MSDLIKSDDLESAISAELNAYSNVVIDGTKKLVNKVAKKCCENIKNDSPARKASGEKYKKGWKVKKTEDSPLRTVCTVYNSKQPSLTYLLENGHATVNGGRTRAIPHIKQNEQSANKDLEEDVSELIKNGH